MLDSWTKDRVKSLRLRLGWSCTDLARRLNCDSKDLIAFEQGSYSLSLQLANELEIIEKQADMFSDEVKVTPQAENALEKQALSQIEFSKVNADIQ